MPLVLGELRWGNYMGNPCKLKCLVPALGGRQESLGTGACPKLPKEFGLDFASQLRGAVTLCDVTHSQYLYLTGPPKSVLPIESPREIWTRARRGPAHSAPSLSLPLCPGLHLLDSTPTSPSSL